VLHIDPPDLADSIGLFPLICPPDAHHLFAAAMVFFQSRKDAVRVGGLVSIEELNASGSVKKVLPSPSPCRSID